MNRKEMIDQAQERVTMMQTLLDSPGWKLFELSTLTPLEAQALHAACESKGSLEAGKHLGVLKTVRDLKSWPEREIHAARAVIADLEQEK